MSTTITAEFSRALELLEAGKNLFITGKAGTGKSTLIREFLARTNRRVLTVAPTGVAALNVGGLTIHRLFGFNQDTTVAQITAGHVRPRRYARVLKALDTLIIDEASMMRADLFDQVAAALNLYGPDPGLPFGGCQIVLVGDLLQLPPVVTAKDAVNLQAAGYASPFFFAAGCYAAGNFEVVQLTQVFRQQGDGQLVDLLNRIRSGEAAAADLAALNERVIPDFVPPPGEQWVTVAARNEEVDRQNEQRLAELPGRTFVSLGERHDPAAANPELPVPERLEFKVGAQVMLTTNDPAGRWANGTLATIQHVEVVITRMNKWEEVSSRKYQSTATFFAQLPPEQPGELTTVGKNTFVVTLLLETGEVVTVMPYTWSQPRPVVARGAVGSVGVPEYTQLPFKLAWAMTIHKAQGKTFPGVIVDAAGGMFAPGQLYVALSRGVSLTKMVLRTPITAKDLLVEPQVQAFLAAQDH